MWSPDGCAALTRSPPSTPAQRTAPTSPTPAIPPPSAHLRLQASQRRRIALFNAVKPVTRARSPPPAVEQHQQQPCIINSLVHGEDETQPESPITVIHARSRREDSRARVHSRPSPSHPPLTRGCRPMRADACLSEAHRHPPPAALVPPSLHRSTSAQSTPRRCITTRRAILQELPHSAQEPHEQGSTHTAAREHAPRPRLPTTSSLLHSNSDPQHQLRTHGFLEAWICVRQQQPGGPAEVYQHSGPLDSQTAAQQQPPKLMTVHDRRWVVCDGDAATRAVACM